jgi:hypothetical protein
MAAPDGSEGDRRMPEMLFLARQAASSLQREPLRGKGSPVSADQY